jgi:D-alanyl-D-alanine carboxypeptidase
MRRRHVTLQGSVSHDLAPRLVPAARTRRARARPPGGGRAGVRFSTPQQRVLAKSFVAIDAADGRILAAKGERTRRPIASLTKVMTALLVIERGDLRQRVTVTPLATRVEPYREGLVAGRRYTRDTLLWSALLASGNDSATALAIDLGDGSLTRFYALANAKARALEMTSTNYTSASGLDDVHNLSTALDQATLAGSRSATGRSRPSSGRGSTGRSGRRPRWRSSGSTTTGCLRRLPERTGSRRVGRRGPAAA